MSLIRELHDRLSDELSTTSYAIDELIGDEELESNTRSSLRELQELLGDLIDELRENLSDESDKTAPVFSVKIRELIANSNSLIKNLPKNDAIEKLKIALDEILDFPKNFLSGQNRKSAKSYELTKREVEVLRLLPTPATFKTMATSLFLTEATVKTHCASLYRKLEVNNRTGAIAVAIQVGLLKR